MTTNRRDTIEMTSTINTSTFVTISNPAITRPPNPLLARQSGQTDCDGADVLHCGAGAGTCYAGPDGFIGCCTASSCAARTTCVPFSALSDTPCDPDTGGCYPCTDAAAPDCFTLTNPVANIYALYCTTAGAPSALTTNYDVIVSLTSTAGLPGSSASSNGTGSHSNSSNDPSSGISGGAIAGIGIGIALIAVAIVLIVVWQWRKRKRSRNISRNAATSHGAWSSPSDGYGLAMLSEKKHNGDDDFSYSESGDMGRRGRSTSNYNSGGVSEMEGTPPQQHSASHSRNNSASARLLPDNKYAQPYSSPGIPSPAFSNVSELSGSNPGDDSSRRVSQLASGNGMGFDGAAFAPSDKPKNTQSPRQPYNQQQGRKQSQSLLAPDSRQASGQYQGSPHRTGSPVEADGNGPSQHPSKSSLRIINPDPQSASTAGSSSPTARTALFPAPLSTPATAGKATGSNVQSNEGEGRKLRPTSTSTATGFGNQGYISAEDAWNQGI